MKERTIKEETIKEGTIKRKTIKEETKRWKEEKQEASGEGTEGAASCCHHQKATPRTEASLRSLKNRLSRMSGQLSGISRMLDENRYCGDILIQVAAIESALQSFGYLILKEHMETCVVEDVRAGRTSVMDETLELIKKLK